MTPPIETLSATPYYLCSYTHIVKLRRGRKTYTIAVYRRNGRIKTTFAGSARSCAPRAAHGDLRTAAIAAVQGA